MKQEQNTKSGTSLTDRLLKERLNNMPVFDASGDALNHLMDLAKEGMTDFPPELIHEVAIRDLLNALKKISRKLPQYQTARD